MDRSNPKVLLSPDIFMQEPGNRTYFIEKEQGSPCSYRSWGIVIAKTWIKGGLIVNHERNFTRATC